VSDDKLKPCPFCGGKASIITGYKWRIESISCLTCWATMPGEDDPIGRWNTRPPLSGGDAREAVRLLRRLTYRGYTSGGRAGFDDELLDACEAAEAFITRYDAALPKPSESTPTGNESLRVRSSEGAVLPCDVRLPPAMEIRAGVRLATLMEAIEHRREAGIVHFRPASEGAGEAGLRALLKRARRYVEIPITLAEMEPAIENQTVAPTCRTLLAEIDAALSPSPTMPAATCLHDMQISPAGDVEQRARELLAAEYEAAGQPNTAQCMRDGRMNFLPAPEGRDIALRAIQRAYLQGQSDSIVLSGLADITPSPDPVSMHRRALALFVQAHDGISADSYDGIEPRYVALLQEAASLASLADPVSMPPTRLCCLCGETKPATEFSNMHDGDQCKECRKWP